MHMPANPHNMAEQRFTHNLFFFKHSKSKYAQVKTRPSQITSNCSFCTATPDKSLPGGHQPVLHGLPQRHGPVFSLEQQRKGCEAGQPQAVAGQLIEQELARPAGPFEVDDGLYSRQRKDGGRARMCLPGRVWKGVGGRERTRQKAIRQQVQHGAQHEARKQLISKEPATAGCLPNAAVFGEQQVHVPEVRVWCSVPSASCTQTHLEAFQQRVQQSLGPFCCRIPQVDNMRLQQTNN